jgi:hypothetical protein
VAAFSPAADRGAAAVRHDLGHAATTHDLAGLASDQVMVADVLPSHLVMGGVSLQSEQDANVTYAQNQGAARLTPQTAGRSSCGHGV